jgi:signal transduction histidine kinase
MASLRSWAAYTTAAGAPQGLDFAAPWYKIISFCLLETADDVSGNEIRALPGLGAIAKARQTGLEEGRNTLAVSPLLRPRRSTGRPIMEKASGKKKGAPPASSSSGIAALRADSAVRKRPAERLPERKTHNLGGRIRELNCLYAFSTLLETPKIAPADICQGLVDLIPPAYQFPEVTCARLVLGGDVYVCAGFRESPWKQSAPVLVRGEQAGTLEVFYLEERPAAEGGPFPIEERRLIDALASRLGKSIERLRAEAALERANAELARLLKERTNELRISDDRLQREIKQSDALEDDLLLERAKFKIILDHMNAGVVIIGADDAIQYINPVLEREFGPVRGRPCHLYFNRSETSCSWCRNREVFDGHSIQWEWESPVSGRIYEIFATPIPDEEGKVSKLEIFHDITDRDHSEKALRESEGRLREISARLLTIQEDERKRFAREIHDGLGQMLASIKFKIAGAMPPATPESAAAGLSGDILRLVRESIEEVRRIQMDLRPPMLDDLGILSTLTWFAREFFGIYSWMRYENHFDIREEEVPEPLKTVLFRITQEALNNTAKHSRADHCVLSLIRADGSLMLEIADNGAGFDVGTVKTGFGLIGMRERAELSGGSLTVESAPGRGTRIRARWPV